MKHLLKVLLLLATTSAFAADPTVTVPMTFTLGGNLLPTATGLTTGQLVNVQTGTAYTIAPTDAGKLVHVCNAGAIAISYPSTLGAGFSIDVQNAPNPVTACAGTGTATITPTSGTINGAATLPIPYNSGCTLSLVAGTDIKVSACTALGVSGGVAPGVSSYIIANLPVCNAGFMGATTFVTNGQTAPLYLGPVSVTGATVAPVFCNGVAWVYR